jgi:DhnA family fructose-bisphosphate aldolase class Ia
MPRTIAAAVAAGPDAIQLTVGQAPLLQAAPGRSKPSLVLRLDTANVYAKDLPNSLFAERIGKPVETALRLDAAGVILNLFYPPDRPEIHRQCIRNICAVRARYERFGMPLMVEPLLMLAGRGGYESSGEIAQLVPLVRQAAELGADIVKCDPPTDAADFHRLVEAAGGRPVLARGGGRMAEKAILERTRALMRQGAAGIVYGRNVFQHPRPARMMRALMKIVHGAATS